MVGPVSGPGGGDIQRLLQLAINQFGTGQQQTAGSGAGANPLAALNSGNAQTGLEATLSFINQGGNMAALAVADENQKLMRQAQEAGEKPKETKPPAKGLASYFDEDGNAIDTSGG